MKLRNIVIPTATLHSGMNVSEGFRECLRCHVPGIPYTDPYGRVTGRFSIRETIRRSCIPDVMVNYADLLDETAGCMQIPEKHARTLLRLPVDPFVDDKITQITSDSTIVKTVALLVKHSSSFLFVIDNDQYIGVVTIEGIGKRMLELERE
jgi:hypothetical protein